MRGAQARQLGGEDVVHYLGLQALTITTICTAKMTQTGLRARILYFDLGPHRVRLSPGKRMCQCKALAGPSQALLKRASLCFALVTLCVCVCVSYTARQGKASVCDINMKGARDRTFAIATVSLLVICGLARNSSFCGNVVGGVAC